MERPIKQGALIVTLWAAVVSSALGVVFVTHKARIATHGLEKLRHDAVDLHVESGQLLLEKSSLAAHSRVEKSAIKNLGMTVPSIEQMVIIKP